MYCFRQRLGLRNDEERQWWEERWSWLQMQEARPTVPLPWVMSQAAIPPSGRTPYTLEFHSVRPLCLSSCEPELLLLVDSMQAFLAKFRKKEHWSFLVIDTTSAPGGVLLSGGVYGGLCQVGAEHVEWISADALDRVEGIAPTWVDDEEEESNDEGDED